MKKLLIIPLLFLIFTGSVIANTKKATLIDDFGLKVVVEVNSQKAQDYFAQGYTLMGNLGTAVESAPALFRTNLASPITTSADSMTLVSATTRDGTLLMGNICFTVDGNISTVEYICGIASGTAISALERGLGSDGVTSYANLKFAHRYGAEVKITDFPVLQRLSRFINGTATFPNKMYYAGDVSLSALDATTTIANIDYVNNVATSGAANLSETVKGIGEGATQAEMQAGTVTGGSGANLLLQNRYATSTPDSAIRIPITKSNGKLNQGFIDLSEAFTFTATTTFNGNISLPNDTYGAGFTHITVKTTSGTWAVPVGVRKIKVKVQAGGGAGADCSAGGCSTGGGGGGGYAEKIIDVSATTSITYIVGGAGGNSSFSTYASSTAGGDSASFGGGVGGVGNGGDLNISGGPGQGGNDVGDFGGMGGKSMLGNGGSGSNDNGGTDSLCTNGSGYGGGGGGDVNNIGSSCTGSGGVIIIEY